MDPINSGLNLGIGIQEMSRGNQSRNDRLPIVEKEHNTNHIAAASNARSRFVDDKKNQSNIQVKEHWNGLPIRSEGSIGGYLSAEDDISDVFKNSPTRATNHSSQSTKHA
mmetsp:Transcript_32920/g.45946  ORF Transcript_32920/g.45946 Transcript_32920/m.45946 type:complete len:110 (-) Transcript_32920:307-636(-)